MARAFELRFKGREPETVERIKFLGHREFCRQEFGDEKRGGYGLQGWFQKQSGCEHDSIYHYVGVPEPLRDMHISKRLYLLIQDRDTKWRRLVQRLENKIGDLERTNELKDETIRNYQIGDQRVWQPVFDLIESGVEEAEI